MTEQQRNVAVVHRYLRAFITKDLNELAEVVADDVLIYGAGQGVQGISYVEQAVLSPGFTVVAQEIIEIFAAGDRVVVEVANTYRHDESGRTTVQSACKMYRVADGRIVQFWGESDYYGLLVGLGLLDPVPA
ncbi:nuclear transport factor 2 family protein [Hamadaea tsunoensis]|uniref:nuclear transport factor 2 family protein n=1 Tax=Hamadaea tsunoensis TaxID=53368 RepID=UPI00040C0D84|nr:nuclear transport factor 2 family protein [Hamadaea tsunoensis]